MKQSQTSKPETVAEDQIEPLIDEHEFSRVTGRGLYSTRRDRTLRKGCRFVKLFGLVRYRPADVRAFIESNLSW